MTRPLKKATPAFTSFAKDARSHDEAWSAFESRYRREILDNGCSEEEAGYALSQFKPLYMEGRSRPFDKVLLSGNPESAAEDLRAWLDAHISLLTAHLVAKDIELLRLRGPNSDF